MARWQQSIKHAVIFRRGLNLWPPFVGSGIVIESIDKDFRNTTVLLKDRVFNRNYVGSHFGGSLFAMTDPFLMLMLIQILGDHYFVWDTGADISFIKPAYGTVKAQFTVSNDDIDRIHAATVSGGKHEEIFSINIVNEQAEVVARVTKRLYVRLKPKYRPSTES